jgi:hypothetical protein
MGQALGRQRQHEVVHPAQTSLALAHDLRLERTGHVPRDPDLDRPDIGEHCLGPGAVAGVPAALADRIMLVVADMVGDLALEGRLQDPLGQLLQQPALTGQPQPVTTGPIHNIEINCSSVTAPTDPAAGSCSTVVSVVIWRLSLDQQIRRYLSSPASGQTCIRPTGVSPRLTKGFHWARSVRPLTRQSRAPRTGPCGRCCESSRTIVGLTSAIVAISTVPSSRPPAHHLALPQLATERLMCVRLSARGPIDDVQQRQVADLPAPMRRRPVERGPHWSEG